MSCTPSWAVAEPLRSHNHLLEISMLMWGYIRNETKKLPCDDRTSLTTANYWWILNNVVLYILAIHFYLHYLTFTVKRLTIATDDITLYYSNLFRVTDLASSSIVHLNIDILGTSTAWLSSLLRRQIDEKLLEMHEYFYVPHAQTKKRHLCAWQIPTISFSAALASLEVGLCHMFWCVSRLICIASIHLAVMEAQCELSHYGLLPMHLVFLSLKLRPECEVLNSGMQSGNYSPSLYHLPSIVCSFHDWPNCSSPNAARCHASSET